MEKDFILMCILLLCSTTMMLAQLPAVDPLSNFASSAIALQYRGLNNTEKDITSLVNQFNEQYSSRRTAIAASLVARFKQRIINRLNQAHNRYTNLKKKNENLSTYSKWRKEKNLDKLLIVEGTLNNTREKLIGRLQQFGVYGEKLNLYQNFMLTLRETDRLMDDIESNLGESGLDILKKN